MAATANSELIAPKGLPSAPSPKLGATGKTLGTAILTLLPLWKGHTMATPAFAVKIKEKNTPFLTQTPGRTLDNVLGYIASIEGWLWGHADPNLSNRLNAIKNDAQFKNFMKQPGTTVAPGGLLPFMRRLDHIAFDIKEAAGNDYEVNAPVTANVAKVLDQSNGGIRDTFTGLIGTFMERYQGDGAAPIQTIVHLPPPNKTYRIDRENLSALPAPRYWTYRIQAGELTYGGILMQSNVTFTLAAVQGALRTSLASSAPGQNGIYVRLSAPQWLTDIVNA